MRLYGAVDDASDVPVASRGGGLSLVAGGVLDAVLSFAALTMTLRGGDNREASLVHCNVVEDYCVALEFQETTRTCLPASRPNSRRP